MGFKCEPPVFFQAWLKPASQINLVSKSLMITLDFLKIEWKIWLINVIYKIGYLHL